MPAKPPAPVYLPAFQRLVPDLLGDAWAEDDGLAPADVDARLAQSPAAEQLGAGLMIPAALREFYLALGNCGDLMETDHYVWDPEDLEVRDGFLTVSYTHLTLPTIAAECRSRWSPEH